MDPIVETFRSENNQSCIELKSQIDSLDIQKQNNLQ